MPDRIIAWRAGTPRELLDDGGENEDQRVIRAIHVCLADNDPLAYAHVYAGADLGLP